MCQPDPLLRIKTRSSLAAFPTIPTFPFSFLLSYTARVVPRASTGSISSAARVSTEFCGTASETDASARLPTLIRSDPTKCPLVEPSDWGSTLGDDADEVPGSPGRPRRRHVTARDAGPLLPSFIPSPLEHGECQTLPPIESLKTDFMIDPELQTHCLK
jgi:hypothetical protein